MEMYLEAADCSATEAGNRPTESLQIPKIANKFTLLTMSGNKFVACIFYLCSVCCKNANANTKNSVSRHATIDI